MDAVPLLAILEVDRVLSHELASLLSGAGTGTGRYGRLICCPQVTAMLLANLDSSWCGLELDAPSQRHFAYMSLGVAEVLDVILEQPGG